MASARTSFISVSYGGDGTPRRLDSYLLDFRYVDRLHGQADTVSLRLQDRDRWSAAAKPAKGDEIRCTIDLLDWWEAGDALSLDTGTLIVDAVSYSAPPSMVDIQAQTVAPSSGAAREKRSRAWEATDLHTIAGDIAAAAGWSLDFTLPSAPQYDRIDQSYQTDLEFLAKLVKDLGGIVKVWNGKLVVADVATIDAATPIKTLVLGVNRILGYSWSDQVHAVYRICQVSYYDSADKVLRTATATDRTAPADAPALIVRDSRVKSLATAIALAEGRLATANKTQQSDSATVLLVGDPDLLAGQTIDLDFGAGIDGRYAITRATHQRGSGGYTTDLGLRVVV